MELFRDLKNYSQFLKSNVKKDVRGKYKGSFLGILWSFINPLLSVVVYAIVFSYIMRFNIDHYLIYLIAGIIPWTFFTTAINSGMNSILFNADILLIDEILAVGDQHFQEKCFNKLVELKKQKKTIVMVSHSLDSVKKLCDRAVWIYNGEVRLDGKCDTVIKEYLNVCR